MSQDVAGKWECTIEAPMGAQNFTLLVAREGDSFRGEVMDGNENKAITGAIDGDTLTWSMDVEKPIRVTLACNATVAGDTLDGKVKAGFFGSYALTGRRIQ